ncbi:unnamed protein product, partial [Prunus brigantina]
SFILSLSSSISLSLSLSLSLFFLFLRVVFQLISISWFHLDQIRSIPIHGGCCGKQGRDRGLGEDPNREGLQKMHLRVAKGKEQGKMEHFLVFVFIGRWNSLNVL